MTNVKPRAVNLHIEELVLHGFNPADRYLIGEAVERELGRLFTEQGVPPSLLGGDEPARLNGGTFEIATGAPAEEVGAQVAQAVYGGLADGRAGRSTDPASR